MKAVNKSFGTTRAVHQVDFAVDAAEIVGLMGGNGAGKSTLMKIVGGLIAADSGEVELLGRRIAADHSPRAAMQLGLRFVHQELSLCPNLRVFENFAVELPDVIRGGRWRARGCEFARAGLDQVFPGNSIDPRAKVGSLSLSQQQMVEIARATSHPATKLLILDEPTSSLGARQSEQLRAYMRQRRGERISFIFISHRLRETLEVADRITVMRNGRVAWTGATSGIGHADLIELLGGRLVDTALARAPAPRAGREALVRLRDLREGGLRGVSLEIGSRRWGHARRLETVVPSSGAHRCHRRGLVRSAAWQCAHRAIEPALTSGSAGSRRRVARVACASVPARRRRP
jgi:ribose transport system ATP-binding protein